MRDTQHEREVNNMKQIDLENERTIYIGTTYEISHLYRHFNKMSIAHNEFCSDPAFNFMKHCGLVVDKFDLDGRELEDWTMRIVSGDTALAMIYDL